MEKKIMENLPFVIRTFDEDLKTLFVSDNIEKIFGISSHSFNSLTRSDFESKIHPDDLQSVLNSYKLLFGEESTSDIEYRIKFNSTEWFWVNEKIFTPYNEDEKVHADGILTDITEKKRDETPLKESEQKFRIISEQALMQIVILQDGVVMYFIGAFLDFLGYSADEIRNWEPNEIFKLVHPADRDNIVEQSLKKEIAEFLNFFHVMIVQFTRNTEKNLTMFFPMVIRIKYYSKLKKKELSSSFF